MNPAFALDHVVIVVGDLGRSVARAREAGFTVVEGGRHPGRNTRNALVVLDDGSYLELITYEQPSQERWYRMFAQHGPGLVDFALLPADIAATVAAARARGIADLEDRPGRRATPEGVEIAWHSARPSTHDLPFLCADVTPRALRVPEGEVRRHANGAIGIPEVDVAVGNLQASLARYRAYLGEDAVEGDEVRITGTRIRLVEDASRARGEGPCAVRLRYDDSGRGEGRIELLDVAALC